MVFSSLYIYRTLLQERYEPQLRQMVKSLEDPASPLKVGLAILGLLVGMAVITMFWRLPLFPAFSTYIVAGIKVMLIFVMIGCLFDAAKKLWRAARIFSVRRKTAL